MSQSSRASREKILGLIRRGNASRPVPHSAAARAVRSGAGSVPCAPDELWNAFAERAVAAAATVARVESPAQLSLEISRFLQANGLSVHVGADAGIPQIDWPQAGLVVADGPPIDDGMALVTGCFGGIAEEGAIALLSGADRRIEHAFLAETHVVVMPIARVVWSLDNFWESLRTRFSGALMPRTINLVHGPSRTADLGVPSRLGAHGPRRLHVIGMDSE